MLPLSNMFYFLTHELAGLRRWRLALLFVLAGSLDRLLFGHDLGPFPLMVSLAPRATLAAKKCVQTPCQFTREPDRPRGGETIWRPSGTARWTCEGRRRWLEPRHRQTS